MDAIVPETSSGIEKLDAYALRSCSHAAAVKRILAAALAAADPARAVQRVIIPETIYSGIKRRGNSLQAGGRHYNLDEFQRVIVLAIGKAALPMAGALLPLLDDCLLDGLIVTKHSTPQVSTSLRVIYAGHPLPDERSLYAGQQVVELLKSTTENDLVICLISGGGSALITAPLEGVSLGDMQSLTDMLLRCGANIGEINTLRRHLDRIKGGGIARLAAPSHMISLILSDVVGDALEAIASGPTAPDPSTISDAQVIIEKYGLGGRIPRSILAALGEGSETLKPGDLIFRRVDNIIVGSNLQSAEAAKRKAEQEGFHAGVLTTSLQGEASQAGRQMACVLRQMAETDQPLPRPACLIAGGETTVTLCGEGRGGRNQELALGAVTTLADLPEVMLVALASDGEDGPTDAAGALVTGETLGRARSLGLDVADHLRRNDAYTFFARLDDLLKPGPTGTNVNDLTCLFAF